MSQYLHKTLNGWTNCITVQIFTVYYCIVLVGTMKTLNNMFLWSTTKEMWHQFQREQKISIQHSILLQLYYSRLVHLPVATTVRSFTKKGCWLASYWQPMAITNTVLYVLPSSHSNVRRFWVICWSAVVCCCLLIKKRRTNWSDN